MPLSYAEMKSTWRYGSPAKLFEQQYGITGIAGDYRLPDGKTAETLDHDIVFNDYTEKDAQQQEAFRQGTDYFDEKGYPADLEAELKEVHARYQDIAIAHQSGDTNVIEEANTHYSSLYSRWRQHLLTHPENPYRLTQADMRQLEDLRNQHISMLASLRHALVALNPELAPIPIDEKNRMELTDFIRGVVSYYPPDDIAAYIQRKDSHPLVSRLENEFLAGHAAGWIMSDKTILKTIMALYPKQAKQSTLYLRAHEAIYTIDKQR